MTAQKVENLTRTRRIEEKRVENLIQYQNESQRLVNAIKNETLHCCNSNEKSKVETDDKRHRREQEALRRETIMRREEEDRIEEAKQQEAWRKERIERDIQRICASSEELKELEHNIKIAYVNKERAAQHQESLYMKEIENTREELIEQHMEAQRISIIKREEAKDKVRREGLVEQKIQLQEQMCENEVCMCLNRTVQNKTKLMLTLILTHSIVSCMTASNG